MQFQAILKLSVAILAFFASRCMSADRKVDLSYEDLLEVKAKGGAVLIDVREPSEIQETGKLPGSINIPSK
jgi:3-mercaptopyruvate sulfurtransferase SseA